MKYLIFLLPLVTSCQSPDFDKEAVREEIRDMLQNYHEAVARDGLMAEFDYLDNSPEFFWVPPGYNSPLSYDSVKSILTQNAPLLSSAKFEWKSLEIYALSSEIGTYAGILTSVMLDTAGTETMSKMIESGTLIKRRDGWKLLSGQSRLLESPQ